MNKIYRDTPYARLDTILLQLGSFSTFNVVNYALLLFPVFLAGMYSHVYVFEALDLDYRCKISECEDTPNPDVWMRFAIPPEENHDSGYSRCNRYSVKNVLIADVITCDARQFTKSIEKCTEFVYNENSAIKDFNLGCQDSKGMSIGSIHNLGMFIALPLAGYVSDRFGRKVALSIASLMNCIFGLLRSFSVNYYMLLALEFLEAGFGAGTFSTSFILAMELVRPESRVLGSTIINIVYVFSIISLAGLAWVIDDWRTLLRVIYAPAALVFSYIWILNESVRWLLSKGRNEEAVAILERAAKMNNVTLAPHALTQLYEIAKSESTEKSDEVSNTSQMSEEQSPKMPQESSVKQKIISVEIMKKLAICSFLWLTCTFVYYSLSINAIYLAGNKYINFTLVALVEIPAYFACLAGIKKYGEKKVMIYTYFLSAIICVGLLIKPKGYPWLFLIIYLTGKFFITMAYSCVYTYVSKVFPSNRQLLLAVCSTVGRFGSVLAPLSLFLLVYYFNLPAILFGSSAAATGLLVFSVPETPETTDSKKQRTRTIYAEDHTKWGVQRFQTAPGTMWFIRASAPYPIHLSSAVLFNLEMEADFFL